MTTNISRSANQKAARVEHGRRKPSKTIKTETAVQYIAPDLEGYEAGFTSFPGNEGESEYLENQAQAPLTSTAETTEILVKNINDSVESTYTENSVDSLNQEDNQSPESSLTKGVSDGTDSSDTAAEDMVSEQIIAGQVNCHDAVLEQCSGKK